MSMNLHSVSIDERILPFERLQQSLSVSGIMFKQCCTQ